MHLLDISQKVDFSPLTKNALFAPFSSLEAAWATAGTTLIFGSIGP
jgi:hypothetical protein